MFEKIFDSKNILKYFSPAQGLLITPWLILKSLKAIKIPYMGP